MYILNIFKLVELLLALEIEQMTTAIAVALDYNFIGFYIRVLKQDFNIKCVTPKRT